MTTSAAENHRGPWLLGSVPDLLFGCGIAWLLVFALRFVAAPQIAAWINAIPLLFAFSIPHYGATLLRAYELPEIRRKHSFVSFYVSVLLSVLFAACLYSPLLGSVVLTVYLSWSPWHYSGQNYGIFLAILGRRNVRPDAGLKRWIYASFCFSFALTLLSLHSAFEASYAPVSYAGTVYQLISLDVPVALSSTLISLASIGYVVSLIAIVAGIRSKASLRSVWPCGLILSLQAMWFVVPTLLQRWGESVGIVDSIGLYSAYGFLWIAAAHAVQYLWFCLYYATRSDETTRILPYLGKCYLGGAAIWILPGVLFGPSLFGRLSGDAGLALMIAAFVNLHHFVLDGAIWKLEDEGVSRVVFRRGMPKEPIEADRASTGNRLRFQFGLGILGGIAIACVAFNVVETKYGFEESMRRGDLDRARTALDRIAWVGTDSDAYRTELGRSYAAKGRPERSREQLQKSLDLNPTVLAWLYLGQLDEAASRWERAWQSYDEALTMNPNHVPSLIRGGSVLLEMERPEEALVLLDRAKRLAPRNRLLQKPLAAARRSVR